MAKDERIHEFVLPECDESYRAYEITVEFERCTCGSSLSRVTRTLIIENGKEVGCDYDIMCAKCGCHISGITDRYSLDDV